MLLTQIALGLCLVQGAPVAQADDGRPAGSRGSDSAISIEAAEAASQRQSPGQMAGVRSAPLAAIAEVPAAIIGTSDGVGIEDAGAAAEGMPATGVRSPQPDMTAPGLSAADAPLPLSYQDVPLLPLYPPALSTASERKTAKQALPYPPSEKRARQARRYSQHPLTTVHFAEAADGTPYAVQSSRTLESCRAPCALQVPAARNRFTFQTSDRTFARKFNLAGPEQMLRLERDGNSGMVAGGAILVSAGIAVDLGFLFASPLFFSDFNGTKREKYGQWALAAGISSMITGALLTTGIILIAKGKPKVSKTFAVKGDASTPSALDALEFSVTPLQEGLCAGAGFRF